MTMESRPQPQVTSVFSNLGLQTRMIKQGRHEGHVRHYRELLMMMIWFDGEADLKRTPLKGVYEISFFFYSF